MYGMDLHVLQGTLVENPELRKNGEGNSYCYFRIAVNYTQKGADGTREKRAKFFECSASKGAATLICQYKKGDIVGFRATMRFKDRKVEQDGTTYVYHDVVFDVAGDLQLIHRTPAATKNNSEATPQAQPAATAAVNQNLGTPNDNFENSGRGDDDAFSLSDDEEGVVGELPF